MMLGSDTVRTSCSFLNGTGVEDKGNYCSPGRYATSKNWTDFEENLYGAKYRCAGIVVGAPLLFIHLDHDCVHATWNVA